MWRKDQIGRYEGPDVLTKKNGDSFSENEFL